MEVEKLKRSTIKRLKLIKEKQELSIPKILAMMESRGQFVSEATLKKVFAEGSEEKNFRYQDTIAPIADVLLDVYGDDSNLDDVESLRQIIREKNKLIESLMIKLEEQKTVYANKEALYKERQAIYEKTINRLDTEVERLNEHLTGCERRIERKDIVLETLLNAYLLKGENAIPLDSQE